MGNHRERGRLARCVYSQTSDGAMILPIAMGGLAPDAHHPIGSAKRQFLEGNPQG
jgi:hypothetical protein